MEMSRKLCARSTDDNRSKQCVAAIVGIVLLVVVAAPAWAQSKSQGPRLRLELAGYRAFESDEATGDYYLQGAAEVEFPVLKHTTLGLRVLPLFLYPEGADDATVYGIAGGLTGRLYQDGENYSGLFAEVGASALWHMKEFKLDDSKVGFLGDCGIGYKFRNSGWHLAAKVEHISNGGMGDKNGGISGLGLAVGYSF
jgi:hypothetical protein